MIWGSWGTVVIWGAILHICPCDKNKGLGQVRVSEGEFGRGGGVWYCGLRLLASVLAGRIAELPQLSPGLEQH